MNVSTILAKLLALFGIAPRYVVDADGGAAGEDDEGADVDGDGADDAEGEQHDDDADGQSGDEGDADETAAASEGDEITISIEGEEPSAGEEEDTKAAPAWVKDLRKTNRELVRRQRELEAENAKLKNPSGAAPAASAVGEKPKLEDFDYDTDKFEAAYESWQERKLRADEQQREREAQERKANEHYQAKQLKYTQAKQSLKVSDFEEAEEVVQDTFSVIQRGLLIAAPRSAELVYALGKNPVRAKALAGIADPVEFLWAAGEVMNKIKVTPKQRTAPAPDRVVRSNVPGATVASRELEKLREKAHRTGDMTEYLAAKRRAKEKASA